MMASQDRFISILAVHFGRFQVVLHQQSSAGDRSWIRDQAETMLPMQLPLHVAAPVFVVFPCKILLSLYWLSCKKNMFIAQPATSKTQPGNQISFSTCSTNFNFHQSIPPFPTVAPTFCQLRQAPAARLHWIHLLGGGGYLVQPHPRVEGEPPGVLDAHRWPGDEDGWWGGRAKGEGEGWGAGDDWWWWWCCCCWWCECVIILDYGSGMQWYYVKLRFVDVGAIVDEFLFNLTELSISPCFF